MKRTTRIAVPLAVVLVGALTYLILEKTAPHVRMARHNERSAKVQVFHTRAVDVQRRWQGYGAARAKYSANVPARVGATVAKLPDDVEAGASVKKGQLLVQLDGSDFRRRLEQAQEALHEIAAQRKLLDVQKTRLQAQLKLEKSQVGIARRDHDRMVNLLNKRAANQADLDDATRKLLQAQRTQLQVRENLDGLGPKRLRLNAQEASQKAAIKQARQNLERATINSPISGVLQAVDVEKGESVAPGQRVARVVRLNVVEVPLHLPASARRDIGVGDAVKINATDQTGACWAAVVSRMSPADDPGTRTTTVYVKVNQGNALADQGGRSRPWLLMPGMFVSASVRSDQTQRRWVVPRRAVKSGRVMTVKDGVVSSRPVDVDYVMAGQMPDLGLPDTQWAVLKGAVGGAAGESVGGQRQAGQALGGAMGGGATVRTVANKDSADAAFKPGEEVLLNASRSVLDGEHVTPILTGTPGDGTSRDSQNHDVANAGGPSGAAPRASVGPTHSVAEGPRSTHAMDGSRSATQ